MPENKFDVPFECYGCAKTVVHNPTISFIPPGWTMIKLHGEAHQFCDACQWGFVYHAGAEHPAVIYPRMREQLAKGHGLWFD